MKRVAFMFPGQGSQYVGMGKDFYDNYPQARDIFNKADSILGYDLTKIIFAGPQEILTQTQYTQPAIFTVSLAMVEVLCEKKILPEAVAGHSLGEYSALVTSGVLSFEDGLHLVQKRGQFIQEASTKVKGTMAAIIGLEDKVVEEICNQIKIGKVEPVNYNCPGQLVIAGEEKAVQEAVKIAQEKKALKAVILNVSGPFHSSFMQEASFKFSKELDNYTIKNPQIPMVANFNARFLQNATEAKEAMIKQISSPVLWEKSIQQLLKQNIEFLIEVGPGKVLAGLTKRISKDIKVLNVEDITSLEKTSGMLNE